MTMIRSSILASIAAITLPVQAQIFKCQEGGKTVFSDKPCHADSAPVNVKPASGEYNEGDGSRARSRALDEQAELMRIDNERAANRRSAVIMSESRRKSESERCYQIRKDKAEALHWASQFRHPANIQREQEKAKHLEQREFFECQ